MGKHKDQVVRRIPLNQVVYERLHADYTTLYDYIGRGANDVMKRLKAMRRELHGEEQGNVALGST